MCSSDLKERGGGEIVIERERQRDRETERERLDSNHLSDDSIPHTPLVKYRVTVRNANCFKKKKKKKKEKTNRSSLRSWEQKKHPAAVAQHRFDLSTFNYMCVVEDLAEDRQPQLGLSSAGCGH